MKPEIAVEKLIKYFDGFIFGCQVNYNPLNVNKTPIITFYISADAYEDEYNSNALKELKAIIGNLGYCIAAEKKINNYNYVFSLHPKFIYEVTDYVYNNCDGILYHITDVNLDEGYLKIDGKYRIDLALKSIYNAYNILSAYSLCRELGVDSETIVSSLNNYVLKNGRVVRLKKGSSEGTLLISKHENSTSYNQTISVIASEKNRLNVIILVDAISRKYFTSETSWLWDIDFNGLNRDHIRRIILTGQYAYDLALRFEYTDIDEHKIIVEPDMNRGFDYLKDDNTPFYVITCFSDAQKVFDRCEVQND